METASSLTTEIAGLSSSVELWRTARLIVLGMAALLTIATIIAQWIELRRSHELAAKQTKLLKMKEDQLRLELAEKDEKIAEANREAGMAKEGAAKATMDAAEANERAGNANRLAAQYEKDAEELRRQNLEMQTSLMPRSIIWSGLAETRLKRFAKTPWELQVPAGDIEASNCGNRLGDMLNKCNWSFITGGTHHGKAFRDGIVVSTSQSGKYLQAGKELVSYLLANRIYAVLDTEEAAPLDRVLIAVGSKPSSALLTPVLRESERKSLESRERAIRDEMEALRKEWRFPPYDK